MKISLNGAPYGYMSELNTTHIRSTKWEFFGVAGLPLYTCIYAPLYTSGFLQRYGVPMEVATIFRDKKAELFMKTEQLTHLAQKMLPVFLNEQWGYYDRWKAEESVVNAHTEQLLRVDLSALSDSELHASVREYRDVFSPPFITNNVIESISFYLQLHLKDMLVNQGIEEGRASDLIDLFGQSAEPSYVKQCAEDYRNAKAPQDVEAVLNTYFYLRNDYTGVKPFTEADLKQLAETTPYLFAKREKASDISDDARRLLTVLQVIATMQDVRKSRFLEMVSVAAKFGKEISRRTQIPFELIELATWEEIEAGVPAVEILRERQDLCVIDWSREGTAVYTGASAQEIADCFNHDIRNTDEASMVKGICASKGKVSGKVVIVFQESEFAKVQDGDILVAMMTRPEFLPVMHKAAAFVCDEGGITSHAAIVAREMKKPCVIGTKIGTKILKDGDMVEVDATAGIVRIIEKS